MSKVYSDPKLKYYSIVNSENRGSKEGYNFIIPSSYIGDPSGCNETKRDTVMDDIIRNFD